MSQSSTPGAAEGPSNHPGPADVEYFTAVQAGAWGDTLRSFIRFVGIAGGSRVLDIGTGPGLLPRIVAQMGVRLAAGCDDSLDMLRRAAGLSDTVQPPEYVTADALHLPFADSTFDVVLATNLLFLLPNPLASLASMARVARPGGRVAYVNPTDAMSVTAAEAFVDSRGITGFDRYSFVNYGRLAECYHRLTVETWRQLADSIGLLDIRSQIRAGGLVVFASGTVAKGR